MSKGMATCGRPSWTRVGLLTGTAGGFGLITTVGLGSATIRGVGLRIIMGDGSTLRATVGAGGRAVGFTAVIIGGPRSLHFSASDMAACMSGLGTSDGFRWLRMSGFIRGTAVGSTVVIGTA